MEKIVKKTEMILTIMLIVMSILGLYSMYKINKIETSVIHIENLVNKIEKEWDEAIQEEYERDLDVNYEQLKKDSEELINKYKQTSTNEIKLRKIEKLFIVGDFKGSGVIDTLFQHNYSKMKKEEIDSVPLYENDLDSLFSWFFNQDINVYLTLNDNETDTLNFSDAFGLYYLINIGDNNSDGKDEIALVVNHCCTSNISYCEIYTLCDNKWTLLHEFSINTGIFESFEEQSLADIESYLENHGGTWFYRDYDEIDPVKMKPLILKKCK